MNKIIKDLAKSEYPLYNENEKCVTKEGIDYIEKKDAGEFLEEKVFGYMFVSRIDGEVFPYFMEGKLPWPLRQNEILYLSFDEESQSTLFSDRAQLLDRVNRSFHRYGRLRKNLREQDLTQQPLILSRKSFMTDLFMRKRLLRILKRKRILAMQE